MRVTPLQRKFLTMGIGTDLKLMFNSFSSGRDLIDQGWQFHNGPAWRATAFWIAGWRSTIRVQFIDGAALARLFHVVLSDYRQQPPTILR